MEILIFLIMYYALKIVKNFFVILHSANFLFAIKCYKCNCGHLLTIVNICFFKNFFLKDSVLNADKNYSCKKGMLCQADSAN